MTLTPKQLRDLADIIEAHENGLPIEFKTKNHQNGKANWFSITHPTWDLDGYEYRIKPIWKMPEPPEGQKWHRPDWTQDMLPEGYRPLLDGELQQKGDEWLGHDQWRIDVVVGSPSSDICYHRRTCRPLPPKVTIRPWSSPDDVPGPTCWLRAKGYSDKNQSLIVYMFDFCLDVAGRGRIRWSQLTDYEYSTDRKTWHKCQIETTESI